VIHYLCYYDYDYYYLVYIDAFWFANQVLVVVLFAPSFVGRQRVLCMLPTSDFVITPHELTQKTP